jgi:ABC-type sulfate/molybdate transport systems ATPase subunit
VTHDMGAVERFCDRAMLIDHGALIEIGAPRRIARAYNELNFGGLVHDATRVPEDQRGAVEIVDAWFEDGHGDRVSGIGQREELRLVQEVRFHSAVEQPIFAFSLRNDVGHTVFATTSAWQEVDTGSFAAGEAATIRVRLENVLATVRHTLTPSVALPAAPDAALDLREDLATVIVHGARATGALVDLPHSYEIERA